MTQGHMSKRPLHLQGTKCPWLLLYNYLYLNSKSLRCALCVCMRVFACAYIHTHSQPFPLSHLYLGICIYICVCIRVFILVYICVHICMFICVCCMHVCVCVCMCVNALMYVCMNGCMYLCMCLSLYLCMFVCMYVCMNVCMHACMLVYYSWSISYEVSMYLRY